MTSGEARNVRRRAWRNRGLLVAGGLLASPLLAPQLLAFPYQARVTGHRIYAERPITPAVTALVEQADRRMLASPLGRARPLTQPIFLTDGGWRWRWLAVSASDSIALSRPIGEPVILTRADPARDRMGNGRRMSDVLMHEFTHGAIRAHFGQLAALRFPTELVEGYADHVAGSSRFSDAEARTLIRAGKDHPALVYWTGRKKVEARLQGNGGNVDRLFADWR